MLIMILIKFDNDATQYDNMNDNNGNDNDDINNNITTSIIHI